MKCLDSTFCIDLLKGQPAARARADELARMGERLAIAAPAVTEVLVGAFRQGGRRLSQALEFFAELEVLDVDEGITIEAARAGGECLRRGEPVVTTDLRMAATTKKHHDWLVSRDRGFAQIPGLTLEPY